MSGAGKRQPSGPPRAIIWAAILVSGVVLVSFAGWLILRGEGATSPSVGAVDPSSASSSTPSATGADSTGTDLTDPLESATTPSAPIAPTETLKPRREPIGNTANLNNGISVTITDVENVKGEGQGIGERSGPALRLTVAVQNDTSKEVSLNLALLNVYFGPDSSPASPLSGPGASAFPATLKAGKTATGTYVFGVPTDQRGRIRVDFTYTTAAPTAIFTGAVRG